jgi:arylsulfatase A-like enzyme
MPERINIIYIHSHDTGRYISPYGCEADTENLQQLADEGTLFLNAFSAAPTCSPSRASLLTGQWPHSCRMYGLINRGFDLPEKDHLLIHTLKKEGYYTVLAGLEHIIKDRQSIGYDKVYQTVEPVKNAIDFLNKKPDSPFFLDVGFWETHRPFPEVENKSDICCADLPSIFPDTEEVRKDYASYLRSVNILDTKIGKLVHYLKEYGLYDNCLIIFTTDHGIAFPKMKCNLTDHGIGVSLIMKAPDFISWEKEVKSMVSQIDIFPTLCDILGIDYPKWLQGKSILPALCGQKDEINSEIYAEVNYHCCYEPQRCIRTQRYKYIRRFTEDKNVLLPNIDDSPSKDTFMRLGLHSKDIPTEQLYDLVNDPFETFNIAHKPEYDAILTEMRGKLLSWMNKTKDPLLQGEIKDYLANTHDGNIYVSNENDISTHDIWKYTDKKPGYD